MRLAPASLIRPLPIPSFDSGRPDLAMDNEASR